MKLLTQFMVGITPPRLVAFPPTLGSLSFERSWQPGLNQQDWTAILTECGAVVEQVLTGPVPLEESLVCNNTCKGIVLAITLAKAAASAAVLYTPLQTKYPIWEGENSTLVLSYEGVVQVFVPSQGRPSLAWPLWSATVK